MNENKITVNGKTIWLRATPSRFSRSESFLKERILKWFASVGIEKQFIWFMNQGSAVTIKWTVNGQSHEYTARCQDRFIDNLGVLEKVIQFDCYAIKNQLKPFGMVMSQYLLQSNATKTPRQILGLDPHVSDKDFIEYKYKQLVKLHHPDNGGSTEEFQRIKDAYDAVMKEFS